MNSGISEEVKKEIEWKIKQLNYLETNENYRILDNENKQLKEDNQIIKQKLEKIDEIYLKHNPVIEYGSQSAPKPDSPQITTGKPRPTLENELKEILGEKK
jgi:hypothetical protein